MTINRRSVLVAIAAGAGLAATAACAPSGSGESGAGGATNVSIMLNWYPYGEHAAFYYGVEQGIFTKHGINLEIKAGQGSTKTVQAVGGKQVDFGWADTPAVLANIDKGTAVKSVGVFLQTTPSAVQVYADGPIKAPADLKGRTIAVSAGDAVTVTFPAFLAKVGLTEADVTQQNLDAAGKIAAMLANRVDGLIGFAHDQGPTIADKSGKEIRYLRYAEAGLNFFSNGLIAPNDTITGKPDLVKSMVAATSESYAAARDNQAAAVKAMAGKDPQMPSESVLTHQWAETVKLLSTPATEGKAPGTNADSDWDATIQVLAESKLLTEQKARDTYYASQFQPGA